MSAGAFWSSFTAALHETCGQVRRYSEKSRKRMGYVPKLNKRKLKGDKVTVFNCSEGRCKEERNLFSNYKKKDFSKTVRKAFWEKEKHLTRIYMIYTCTLIYHIYDIYYTYVHIYISYICDIYCIFLVGWEYISIYEDASCHQKRPRLCQPRLRVSGLDHFLGDPVQPCDSACRKTISPSSQHQAPTEAYERSSPFILKQRKKRGFGCAVPGNPGQRSGTACPQQQV